MLFKQIIIKTNKIYTEDRKYWEDILINFLQTQYNKSSYKTEFDKKTWDNGNVIKAQYDKDTNTYLKLPN